MASAIPALLPDVALVLLAFAVLGVDLVLGRRADRVVFPLAIAARRSSS